MPKRKQHADKADGRAALWHWLAQVQDDPETTDCIDVAVAILRFYNRKRGWAWPRQAVLADMTHNSVRQVQRKLYRLRTRGHLDVISGQGRSTSNRLRPILKNASRVTPFTPEKHDTGDVLNSEKHDTDDALLTGKHVTGGGKVRQKPPVKHDTGVVQNHIKNHITEPDARAREDRFADVNPTNVEPENPMGEIVPLHRPVREEKPQENPQPEPRQRDAANDMELRRRLYGSCTSIERAKRVLEALGMPVTRETVDEMSGALPRVYGHKFTREQMAVAVARAARKGTQPSPGKVFEWLLALCRERAHA